VRGQRPIQPSFVSLINVEMLIMADQPIRAIKWMRNAALRALTSSATRSTRRAGALDSDRDAAEGEGAAATAHGSAALTALRAAADGPDVPLVLGPSAG
jgi:hypothetical protein